MRARQRGCVGEVWSRPAPVESCLRSARAYFGHIVSHWALPHWWLTLSFFFDRLFCYLLNFHYLACNAACRSFERVPSTIEPRRSPVARARTNGACVALLPVVEIVLVAVSSLKDSSSGVNWIDHKVVSQSSALSRVYALSEIFTTLTTAGLTGWQSAFKRRLQRWLTLSDCTDRSREGVPCSGIQYGSQIWMRKHVERLPAQHMATAIETAAEPV